MTIQSMAAVRWLAAVCATWLLAPAFAANPDTALPVVIQELVVPPAVPPPITRTTPARVVVNLTIEEIEREIAPGTRYMFWTFDGTVPGKLSTGILLQLIRSGGGVGFRRHLPDLITCRNGLPLNPSRHSMHPVR